MPKVSDAHRAARRRQILDAARRCFIEKGFHDTSMPDVFRESGLSAGAVYRYFPSKHAIVAAIAEEAIARALLAIDEVTGAEPVPPLDESIERVLAAVERHTGEDGTDRIILQVWGESMRDPELAAIVSEKFLSVRPRFVELARRARAAGDLPEHADPEQVGTVLFGLAQGFMTQRLLVGDVAPATFGAGLGGLLATRRPALR